MTDTTDRECADLTECSALEYISVPHTVDTDHTCTAVTNCVDGKEYETRSPTKQSNRECAALVVCDEPAEFEVVGATAVSDRACQETTVCNDAEYETKAVSSTSDR